jgi:DNA-binding response OmpR family regulator
LHKKPQKQPIIENYPPLAIAGRIFASSKTKNMKILIADDQPMVLQTIKLKLQKAGYDVFAVSDGRQAIEQYDTIHPDLIITDILMPYVSGMELMSHVRSNEQQHTPIIILSTIGFEGVIVDAFKLGADDYIIKPFKLNEVVARTERLVGYASAKSFLQVIK